MRQLLRWAFNFSAVVSAVLFVAVCVLWVRSYEGCVYSRDGRVLFLRGDMGQIEDALAGADSRPTETARPFAREAMHEARFWARVRANGVESSGWSWHGFEGHGGVYAGVEYRLLAVPYYALALPAAALAAGTALAAVRLAGRQRRRRAEGRCLACGYDLRATPGRCPECGAVPAKGATT